MKTILKIILVIALALCTDILFASGIMHGNMMVNILPVTAEKALVNISTTGNSNIDLTVTNNKGNVLISKENLEPTKDYRSEFDFHTLKNGTYKVTAVGQDITTERLFRMTDKGIKVGKEKTYMKPNFAYKDGILKLSFLNFQRDNTTINLKNKKQLLFTKDCGDTFTVLKGLDLSHLENGTYEVVLSAGNKAYSYTIDKR